MEIFLFSSLIFLVNLPSIYSLISLDRPAHFSDLEMAQRNARDLDNVEKEWPNDRQSRRLLLESVAGKKSIFRDRPQSSLEQDQFVEELAKKMREEKDQNEELRFLRDEPGKREDGTDEGKSPFDQAKFDSQFPVHNLCGPWNSGRQAIDLEWAEPADKLLKLLNSGKQKYNLFMAPGQMTGHATNVSIAIYIESMSSFKAQTMDFEVDMYFAMGWYDRRLAHNCTHPLLIAHKPIAERIWTPDLYFLNAKFAYLQEVTTPNFMVIVYPDGLVFKTLRIDVTLSCNMDLQLFPFDKQECPMVIQSFAYIESMLNLSWHVDPPFYPIATNPELKLNDMAITGMRFERCSSPYTMFRGTGVWSCLRGYIVMKRLVLFHLIQTYIPSAMLVSISWMTFWLDPRASPARISLTITSLLTLTTMSNGARQDLPQVSYIKAMDIWQTFSQALIFLVLLEYSFVSFFYTRRTFRCLHRRRQSVDARRNSKPQMMRQTLTSDDVRLLGQFGMMDSSTTMMQMPVEVNNNENQNNNNNNNNNFLRPPGMLPNSLHQRRRHSTPKRSTSTLTMTMPPPTKTSTGIISKNKPINGLEGFRHRRLCTQPSDFELVEMAKGGTGEGEMESSREEMDWGGAEKHCKKCQFLDQQKARAIDKYSRLLFPAIFVGFCSLYWLYYMGMVITRQEN